MGQIIDICLYKPWPMIRLQWWVRLLISLARASLDQLSDPCDWSDYRHLLVSYGSWTTIWHQWWVRLFRIACILFELKNYPTAVMGQTINIYLFFFVCVNVSWGYYVELRQGWSPTTWPHLGAQRFMIHQMWKRRRDCRIIKDDRRNSQESRKAYMLGRGTLIKNACCGRLF